MSTIVKEQLLASLRGSLRTLFTERHKGGPAYDRAQGRVDGYMQALLDSGLATQRELLLIVSQERTKAQGPAWSEVSALATKAA